MAKQYNEPTSKSAAVQLATVYDAYRALGLGGEPVLAARSPFVNAQGAMFFMSLDGQRWHDTSLRQGGGVLDLLELALGVERHEARWLLRELERDLVAGTLLTVPNVAGGPSPAVTKSSEGCQ